MCGIAGYVGVTDPQIRLILTTAMGLGIDTRGGHASGFVTATHQPRVCKRLGPWGTAKKRFLHAGAASPNVLLHARYSTHFENTDKVSAAHPFTARRNGLSVLWGVHNGSSPDAETSAKVHNRPFDVDSREILELLADNKRDEIHELSGWGALAWVTAEDRHAIRIVRACDSADMYAEKTTCGSMLFGSTHAIVEFARMSADLVKKESYKLEVGKEYRIGQEGGGEITIREAGTPPIKFGDMWTRDTYTNLVWDKQSNRFVQSHTSKENDSDWSLGKWEKEWEGITSEDEEDEFDDMRNDPYYNTVNDKDFDRAAFMRWLAKNERGVAE